MMQTIQFVLAGLYIAIQTALSFALLGSTVILAWWLWATRGYFPLGDGE